jgi:hypothetical protein
MKDKLTDRWYLLPAIVILLVSQFDWSYGFYQLLRVVVCFSTIYHAYLLYERENSMWMLYGFIALLFNPFMPIHLERTIWAMVDFVTAFVLLHGIYRD